MKSKINKRELSQIHCQLKMNLINQIIREKTMSQEIKFFLIKKLKQTCFMKKNMKKMMKMNKNKNP